MAKSDLVGGLKLALSRGETLQKAMQSFYNAGYKKEEIEEAARILQTHGFRPQTIAKPIIKSSQKLIKKTSASVLPAQFMQKPSPQAKTKQVVSNYEIPKEKPKKDMVTILLVIILVVLLGILVSVFLFKEDLVNFLNNFLD